MLDTLPPQINETKLDELGARLWAIWPTYVSDRKMIEEAYLQNLRQIKGIYDPGIKIPSNMSRAYPKLTAWMLRGTVARLMQMLFPSTEKNYSVKPSPLPDLSTEQLQEVLDALVAAKAQGGDATRVTLTDEEIEKAIHEFAKGKAERMEMKVQDDLEEMDYTTLARKVVRSAVGYRIGIVEGPLHHRVKARTWKHDEYTGKYTAIEVDKLKPLFDFCPVWEYYPDMTAVSLDKQDGTFRRRIMIREQVEELISRPDFFGDRITAYLHDHQGGNYKAQWFESEIKGEPRSAQSSVANKEGRKYEVLSYWGSVTGHELRGAGITVSDADLGKSFHANVWLIDNRVIKLKLSPFQGQIRHFHEFVFEDDDMSILGTALPDTLRDSQLSVCETIRAALDNMSVIGPMAEVNDDLLTPGQDVSISKHKTWRREGTGASANVPAVRNISIESHLGELIKLAEVFLGFAEKESGLPPPSLGDMSGGGSEALRTQRNASMFLGAAALPVRDTVRNFDSFTKSIISSLVAWNQKYDPNPARDGDHDVIPRGSTSLIAKEVLAGSLENFRAGLTPDELPYIKTRGLLIERVKVNDLPVDDLIEDEEVAQAKIDKQAQMQAQQLQNQEELIKAQVQETLARAFKNVATGESASAGIQADVVNSIIKALQVGDKTMAEHVKAVHTEEVARVNKQTSTI